MQQVRDLYEELGMPGAQKLFQEVRKRGDRWDLSEPGE